MIQEMDLEQISRVWKSLTGSLTSYFDDMTKAINNFYKTYWPAFAEAQRVESRRIHRLYRRKQKARRKRNRRKRGRSH
jgi:hypothetical protein